MFDRKKTGMNFKRLSSLNTTNTTQPLLSSASAKATVAITVIFFAIFVLISIILLILSCIFARKQPLKSRGCTFVALVFVVFMGGTIFGGRSLAVFLLPSYRSTIRCFVDVLALMPVLLSFISLMIARNVRFVFILNINWFKNLIFGNTRVSELLKEKASQKNKKKNKAIQQEHRSSISVHRQSVVSVSTAPSALLVEEIQQNDTPTEIPPPTQDVSVEITAPSTIPTQEETSQIPITETTIDSDDMLSSSDDVANYFENSHVDKKALQKLGCLKAMTSYWVSFGIVALVVIVWYIFAILYMGISLGSDPNCYLVSPGINFAFSMILYSITCIILVVDLLLHIKDLLRCRLHHLFCVHDKFLFRIEFLLIAPANLLLVFNNLLISYVQEYYLLVSETLPYLYVLMILTIGYLHLFSLIGFVLLVTIIWNCRATYRRKKERRGTLTSGTDQFLDSVMRDSKIQTLFREFCVQEWSLENFLCYQDLNLWNKKLKHSQSRLKSAKIIHDKFIKTGCSLEVNISNHARDKTKHCFQKVMDALPQPIIPGKDVDKRQISKEELIILTNEVSQVFDFVLKEVKSNLNDTLYRFTLSSAFKHHMDDLELKHDMIENV